MNYYIQLVKNVDNYTLKVLNYYNEGVKKNKLKNYKEYDHKLYNNIVRARTKILDYCYNNDFKYFLTATISSKYDRSDLKSFLKQVTQAFRDLRKTYDGELFYLIIPELHRDKKNWHIHGVIGGDIIKYDMYENQFGYESLCCLDKLGFNSLSEIRSKDACNVYITKYITKGLANGRNKGEHLFYTSRNLNVGEKLPIIPVSCDKLLDFRFDFISDDIKLRKYFNINVLDQLFQEYYNSKKLDIFIDKLNNLN